MNEPASIVNMLRSLPSEQAATLLMQTYPLEAPNIGRAFKLMSCRSWRRPDQIRLARYYLARMPFATALPYEVFAAFMSLRTLIVMVRETASCMPDEWPFIAYHLAPVLKNKIKVEDERELVRQFLEELGAQSDVAIR